MGPLTAATRMRPMQETLARRTLVCRISWNIPVATEIYADPTLTAGFERPSTPTSITSSNNNEPPEFISRPQELSDDDDEDYSQRRRSGSIPRKKGGYDSRIEQILYENPELPIIISDAGKDHTSGGSYIVYTIRTGVTEYLDEIQ